MGNHLCTSQPLKYQKELKSLYQEDSEADVRRAPIWIVDRAHLRLSEGPLIPNSLMTYMPPEMHRNRFTISDPHRVAKWQIKREPRKHANRESSWIS
mmetsp:Transcript_25628/g.42320  ORF Transcript_25628/g.42320 Transcript_25628/m.42320 type:complete len:97 (-) Transcript_25628:1512-1802(-)